MFKIDEPKINDLIDIKYNDRKRYYEAFDAYYIKKDLSVMTKLFAEYINERLDEYLRILD